MATQGFQLSQFERAPSIPSNIGVVDTKSIYGAVVDALRTNEALRTTQLAQAKTDAELGLARDKALTEQSLLEPEAASRRARANLLAAESVSAIPGIEGAARARRAQDALAAETAQFARVQLPLTADVNRTELERRLMMNEAFTPDMASAQMRANLLANQMAARSAESGMGLLNAREEAERAELALRAREAQIRNDDELIRRRALSQTYAGMPSAIGTIQYAQRIISDPNSTPEMINAALVAMKAIPTPSSDPNLRGRQSFEAQLGSQVAKIEAGLPKGEGALRTFQGKSDNFNRLLDDAEKLISPYSTGYAALVPLPTSQAEELQNLILSIQANIGFDALQEMRASSPTGAALGAISDEENKRLSSTIVSLSPTQSAGTLLYYIGILRANRAEAVERLQEGLERDRMAVQAYRTDKKLGPSPLIPQSFNYKDFKVEVLPATP